MPGGSVKLGALLGAAILLPACGMQRSLEGEILATVSCSTTVEDNLARDLFEYARDRDQMSSIRFMPEIGVGATFFVGVGMISVERPNARTVQVRHLPHFAQPDSDNPAIEQAKREIVALVRSSCDTDKRPPEPEQRSVPEDTCTAS